MLSNLQKLGLMALALAATACSTTGSARVSYGHPHLIFDAIPSNVSPQSVIHHSDWPWYPSAGPQFETIYYSQRTIDVQDNRRQDIDRTYRRFDSVRVGRQLR